MEVEVGGEVSVGACGFSAGALLVGTFPWVDVVTHHLLQNPIHQTVDVTLPDYIFPSAYSAITRGHNLKTQSTIT